MANFLSQLWRELMVRIGQLILMAIIGPIVLAITFCMILCGYRIEELSREIDKR